MLGRVDDEGQNILCGLRCGQKYTSIYYLLIEEEFNTIISLKIGVLSFNQSKFNKIKQIIIKLL